MRKDGRVSRRSRMFILTLWLCSPILHAYGLIYEGTLKTKEDWQFLTRFCYKTRNGALDFYFEYPEEYCCQEIILYYDIQWPDVYPQKGMSCREKRSVTVPQNHQTLLLSDGVWNSGCVKKYNEKGKGSIVCKADRMFRSARARWWYLVVANCGSNKGLDLNYRLILTNGNTFWTKHFSADEQNILQTNIFFLCITTVVLMVSLYVAYLLSKRQLFHTTYKIFVVVQFFEIVALVIFILYYVDYGQDGKPNQSVKNLARASHWISEIILVVLLILLGKGWTVTRGRISAMGQVKLSVFCTFYTIAFASLFIYEAKAFDPGEVLYIYESPAGAGICVLRVIAWLWFCYGIFFTLKKYKDKRLFYYPFWCFYTLWFLSGPFVVVIALYIIDAHVREQTVNAVERTVSVMASTFFLFLTRPSAANKNFPFHVRTSQIGILSNSSSDSSFDQHAYCPSNALELTTKTDIVSMFSVTKPEQFVSGNLTSLNSIPSNSPVHENNTFNNINLYASCTDELNYNAKNVSYKPKVNNNLVNSQGQTYNNNFINNDEQTNSNNNELELNKESYNPNDEKRRKISTTDMSMFAANKRVEGKKIEATERVQLPQSNLFQTATQSQQPEKSQSTSISSSEPPPPYKALMTNFADNPAFSPDYEDETGHQDEEMRLELSNKRSPKKENEVSSTVLDKQILPSLANNKKFDGSINTSLPSLTGGKKLPPLKQSSLPPLKNKKKKRESNA